MELALSPPALWDHNTGWLTAETGLQHMSQGLSLHPRNAWLSPSLGRVAKLALGQGSPLKLNLALIPSSHELSELLSMEAIPTLAVQRRRIQVPHPQLCNKFRDPPASQQQRMKGNGGRGGARRK